MYVRAGLYFPAIDDCPTAAADDTTEVWGIHLLDKHPDITIINAYRLPIRADRVDHFDPTVFPINNKTLLVGDLNEHHPMWDAECNMPDAVGERMDGWKESDGDRSTSEHRRSPATDQAATRPPTSRRATHLSRAEQPARWDRTWAAITSR